MIGVLQQFYYFTNSFSSFPTCPDYFIQLHFDDICRRSILSDHLLASRWEWHGCFLITFYIIQTAIAFTQEKIEKTKSNITRFKECFYCLCEVVAITQITTTISAAAVFRLCFETESKIQQTKSNWFFLFMERYLFIWKKDPTSGNLEFLKGIRQFISFLTFFTLFVESNYIAFWEWIVSRFRVFVYITIFSTSCTIHHDTTLSSDGTI